MFTEEEKKILLDLINNVPVQGNRQTIGQTLEKLDRIARKIEALPVEEEVKPSEKKPKK